MASHLKLALIFTAADDHNSAFRDTQGNLNQRIKVLRKDDLEVSHLEGCKSFEELAQYVDSRCSKAPIYMQLWRGHGGPDKFELSEGLNGKATLQSDESMQQFLKKICGAIQRNGILVTESCWNGSGKENFSKYLTGFCNAGVVVIGSKTNTPEVEILPGLPRYQRFRNDGKDATRIYYKTESGTVQNISSLEFTILWNFLGCSSQTFDLCYSLLGERNDPVVYARIQEENQEVLAPFVNSREAIKDRMKRLNITRADVGPIWQEMLESVEKCPSFSSLSKMREEPIPLAMRQVDLEIEEKVNIETQEKEEILHWEKKNLPSEEIAYFFLLGMAALQQHKSIFQLCSNPDEESQRFVSAAVYALSGLPIHAKDSFSAFQRLEIAIHSIKESYQLAKRTNTIEQWFSIFVDEVCTEAVINSLQAFYEEKLCQEAMADEALQLMWKTTVPFEIMWGRIWQELPPEKGPEPVGIEAKRAWLCDPKNAQLLDEIKELSLSDCCLTALPPEICHLTGLQNLYLGNNELTTLPPEIGKLIELREFSLENNKLATLPPEIGNLTQLEIFSLASNQFATVPLEVCQLTQMWKLSLNNNQLTILPREIGKLIELRELSLEKNQLEILPPEIGKLTKLEILSLARNQFATVPLEVCQLTELRKLFLNNNQLTILPPEIGKLTKLQTLSLNNNKLTTLPPEIGKLIELWELYLEENQLEVIPPEIGKLTKLQILSLNNNQLEVIPPEIGNFPLLKRLPLYGNRLTTLPAQIGNLSQLTQLRLSENLLETLPPEIGNLSGLTGLYLSQNRLTTLPAEIGKLSRLRDLSLPKNQISTLPPEIGNLPLMALNLFANKLVTLPPQIANLSRLRGLFLNRNLLIFILNTDFHQLDDDQNLEFQLMVDKFSACSNYECQTSLAFLCQQIHLGKEDELLEHAFEQLSDEMQQRIREAWAAMPSSSSGSSEAGEDLFADRASFAQAVITALQGKWHSLSEEQQYQTYAQVAIWTGQPEEEDYYSNVSWGQAHAEKNIIRLIDAMEFVN